MTTVIREAVYIGKKKVISLATTSSDVARGVLALTSDSNIEDVTISGTGDANGPLNWIDVTVRGDLSEKAQASIVRVIQDCRDSFIVKKSEPTDGKSETTAKSSAKTQSSSTYSAKKSSSSSKASKSKAEDKPDSDK